MESKEKKVFEITQAQLYSALVFVIGLAISFYVSTKNSEAALNARMQILESAVYNNGLRSAEDRSEIKQQLREIQLAVEKKVDK